MNMLPDVVIKYLQKYSVQDWKIENIKNRKFDNVVVVPAICEYEDIRRLINSFLQNDEKYLYHTLLLFVLNNLVSSHEEIRLENLRTMDYLRTFNSAKITIGYVDASSPGKELPENHGGVGLARKIGMDLALTVFDYSSASKKILICTDADCTVEKNYLQEITSAFNKRDLSAAVVNYRHDISGEDENTAAIICYEYYLRYYVLGLKYANSPYAFHTIGSTMVCDYKSYIKAEGMNKRKAAEDFYFLEKLAKVTAIENISSTTVHPSARASWRVPFGTGQRVNRFLSKERDEYKLYSPEVFEILKSWLTTLNKNSNLVSDYLSDAERIHPELYKFLIQQEFDRAFSKILNHANDEKQLNLQKKLWFDGFRTLKLIHHLRDNGFPEINTFDAIDLLFEKMKISCDIKRDKGAIPELSVQKKYLESLRELDRN